MDHLPDIQGQTLNGSFVLTRVGITEVKKPVKIKRDGRTVTLIPTIDVFVDLPAQQKGSHMSRNIEAIDEVVDDLVRDPSPSLEDLCLKVGKLLLKRHDYAKRAEVQMVADYFLERSAPLGRKCLENYKLLARAMVYADGRSKREIGVEAVGMTACPCAMETAKNKMECSDDGPFMSHNQRNVGTLILEVSEGHEVEADVLIDIVESSMSSPTFQTLKRPDEAEVVIKAHTNPMFVEDVVRNMLSMLINKYGDLPDETRILARSVSEESIHKHNAFAERTTTLGVLKSPLDPDPTDELD